jgi:hypothetical protein
MKSTLSFIVIFCVISIQIAEAQVFNRSELSTQVNTPWEILYGPDDYLWLTESTGRVSRVDPVTGSKVVVYTAPRLFQWFTIGAMAIMFSAKYWCRDIRHGIAS